MDYLRLNDLRRFHDEIITITTGLIRLPTTTEEQRSRLMLLNADLISKIPTEKGNSLPTMLLDAFNNIENITADFDNITKWVNPYSAPPHLFTRENGVLKPYVERWFNWLKITKETFDNL